jgi:predicted extracellular nuclease
MIHPRFRLFHTLALTASLLAVSGRSTQAGLMITEWMYNGSGTGSLGEFIELTNVGASAIDMTGWSFDDNSRTPGSESLAALGAVAAGESVIFTDMAAADFRTNWNLPSSVKILGGNTNNLGRSDEINIYDNSNVLVDRLTYNDQAALGPRTNSTSGNPLSPGDLGKNDATHWILSSVGDRYGSYKSALNEVGNPGIYADVPEPGLLILLLMAGVGGRFLRRK